MNYVLVIVIVAIVYLIITLIIVHKINSRITYKSKKDFKRSSTEISTKLNRSKQLETEIKMRRISNMLNKLPMGNLTKEKYEEWELFLEARSYERGTERVLPYEVHVYQWLFVGIDILFSLLFFLFSPLLSLILLLCSPLFFKLPVGIFLGDNISESSVVKNEFIYFYRCYYSQYLKKGNTLKLEDVVTSYADTAPTGMRKFVNNLLLDSRISDSLALYKLNKSYNLDIVSRFCQIATQVSRGDSDSSYAVSSFYDYLNDIELSDQMEKLEKVETHITQILVVAVTVQLLIITAVFCVMMFKI